MMQPHCKNSWQLLKKLNTNSPYEPEIPFLGIHPREIKTYVYAKTLVQIFTLAKR